MTPMLINGIDAGPMGFFGQFTTIFGARCESSQSLAPNRFAKINFRMNVLWSDFFE